MMHSYSCKSEKLSGSAIELMYVKTFTGCFEIFRIYIAQMMDHLRVCL